MKTKTIIPAICLMAFSGLVAQTADDVKLNMPIIQTKYTADPAPMLYNDTVLRTCPSKPEDDGR